MTMPDDRYRYRGDRWTLNGLRGARCSAVRGADGRCIRGRNGNMLVRFESGARAVVTGRQLRKVARRDNEGRET